MTKDDKAQQVTEKLPKCGIIMPISSIEGCPKEHWADVKNILSDAIKDAGFEAHLVSDADDSGIIQKRIVQNLYHNEMIVCDVSCKNANVMFELGMRLAFDKPTIIVMDNMTQYAFDTAPIEHLSYPRDLSYFRIVEFKRQLAGKIKGTYDAAKQPDYTTFLKHFGEFKTASISPKEVKFQDLMTSRFDDLSKQIQEIRSSQRSSLDSDMSDEVAYRVVKGAIEDFCKDSKISLESLYGTSENSEIRQKLFSRLSSDGIIRHLCHSPRMLSQIIGRIILPF